MTLCLPYGFMHDLLYSPCLGRLNGGMPLRLTHDSLDSPSNGMYKWCGLPLIYMDLLGVKGGIGMGPGEAWLGLPLIL